jgi:hypothetical protein
MRRFSKLFMGQAAPVLHALSSAAAAEASPAAEAAPGLHSGSGLELEPLGGGGFTYRRALAVLQGPRFATNNASHAWAALSK